jgi:phage terminase large subunit-like protein
VYDEYKATRAISFIKQLKHTKGKWKGIPFTMLPWQELAITDIFGTVRENGCRQYKIAYLEIAKKQGKSELGAAIALQGLCADDEWAAEVYGCAADRGQASIIYDVAIDMVDQNPTLRKHMNPILSQKRLVYMPTKSFYQVLSSEAYSKHGLNASRVVFDELHAQPNRELYDVMIEGSGDARTQPLYFFITTAGKDPDRGSIGWEVHKDAVNVLTGIKQDPTFYAMLYGLDRDERRIWLGRSYETIEDDLNEDEVWRSYWGNPEIWRKVNPSINHTVQMDTVKEAFASAKGNLAKERNFRWLRLNCWEKLKTNKWLGLDFWDRCKGIINPERLRGRRCYGGLDLSSKIDLTAFVLLFPPDEINTKWMVLPFFWVPEDRIKERVETDHVDYDVWDDQGNIMTTPGNVIDYDFIEAFILDLAKKYDIHEIGYDEFNATQTAIHLEAEGLTLAPVRPGFRMGPAMDEIMQLTMGHKITHDGHPVMRWNMGNVETKVDVNGNIRPVKGKGIERIDGVIGLINAMTRALLHKEENTDAGLFVI